MKALLPQAVVSATPIPPMQLEVFAPAIDFRPDTESVDDQKAMGSCVAHAGQTALEICYQRAGQPTDLSRMYLYYFVQKLSGTLGQVGGGAITGQLGEAINAGGLCREETYPYDVDLEGQAPPAGSEIEAREMFPAGSVNLRRVSEVSGIKRALNRGQPVMITIYVHRAMMYDLGDDWRTHEWDVNQMPVGLHAVCVIGYDDAAQRLLIENSWGSGWGDGGFFGIPYSYCTGGKLLIDSFAFDKLPVPLLPVDGYTPEDIPKVSDGILTIPRIRAYFPNWTRIEYVNVAVRILKIGLLTINDETAPDDESNYILIQTVSGHQMLVLLSVEFEGTVYQKVSLTDGEYEILSATPT